MTSTDVGMLSHMGAAVKAVLRKADLKPGDIAAIALQQSDGASPYNVASGLGFSKEKVAPGIYADKIGDCGAASSLISLALILETAKANERLLLISYGWGAGSDAFVLEVLEKNSNTKAGVKVKDLLERKIVVDYAVALKYERKFHSAEFKVSAFA
jgi:hydroxymethylglutaryl-CoA synthase